MTKPEFGKWQLIETAPKDGSRILCWAPGWEPTFLMWKENNRFDPPRQYFGDCVEYDDYALAEQDGGPTHWMPIPDPPNEGKQ